MSKKLNLNSDLGESFGAWEMAGDDAMLGIVNSTNVACGYHAGDPLVMIKTVTRAKENGVSIDAHPSFPDLQGFGRRRMDIPAAELEAMLDLPDRCARCVCAGSRHAGHPRQAARRAFQYCLC